MSLSLSLSQLLSLALSFSHSHTSQLKECNVRVRRFSFVLQNQKVLAAEVSTEFNRQIGLGIDPVHDVGS